MLIDTFEKLTSGQLISKIIFTNGNQMTSREGLKVAFAKSDEFPGAWICYDETGIWLSSNAHHYKPQGDLGFSGFTEPLSAIQEIVFVPATS